MKIVRKEAKEQLVQQLSRLSVLYTNLLTSYSKDLIKGLIQYTILHDLIQSDMHAMGNNRQD